MHKCSVDSVCYHLVHSSPTPSTRGLAMILPMRRPELVVSGPHTEDSRTALPARAHAANVTEQQNSSMIRAHRREAAVLNRLFRTFIESCSIPCESAEFAAGL